jgi:hypothetical protein
MNRAAFLLVALGLVVASPVRAAELIGVARIWDQAPHSAFTDLIRFRDAWYCTFREGSAHIPGTDGKIRVLRRADGTKWESAAVLAEPGIDLRDPKLSVTPDGRLMMVLGGSVYDGAEPTPNRKLVSARSRVSFSADGSEWTPPQKVDGVGEGQWLWRVTWHKGVGYGVVYSLAKRQGGGRALSVWRTADGVKYEEPVDPKPGIDLTEATARFLADDTMVILLRGEEKDRHAWVGTSKGPAYDAWTWRDGGRAAQGPNFVVLADRTMYYAGRDFDSKGAARTVFGRMTAEKLEPLITLPSGGDTSYPGIVDAGDGTLWVSYYSSHEKKSHIYLAKIRVAPAK